MKATLSNTVFSVASSAPLSSGTAYNKTSILLLFDTKSRTPESDKEVDPWHRGDYPEARTESQRLKASLILFK